jgi:hypothetical protein
LHEQIVGKKVDKEEEKSNYKRVWR